MNRTVSKGKTKTKQIKKQQEVSSKSFFLQTNDFFERNQKIFIVLSMIAGILMCILLFDVKVSLSGDDSEYLINAGDFWRDFRFPGSFGALYPIVISPIVGLFGYQFILLKSISCIFMLAFLWFFHKSFRHQVSATVLYPTLLLISINSFIFYYAGQTYSEAFFMFVQALFFFYFLKHFIEKQNKDVCLKTDWKKYILLGCIILMMGLTRAIGYGAIGVLILFFAINRRWKELIYSVFVFFVVFVLFQLIKYAVWPGSGSGYDINTIMAKDHYNPIEKENLAGFLNRFTINSHIYLSNFLCQFLGVIPERPSINIDMNVSRTILLYLLYFGSLIVLFKKNNPLLFVGIYVGVMLFSSFFILHTVWGQDRFIMIYYPYILLFLLGGIYYLFQIKTMQKFFFLYPLILIMLCIGTFSSTQKRVGKNIPVLQENLLGDQLYGLTPDVVNFINGSKWAAANLEKDAIIVSRKPSISKVYTGRDFAWAPTDITVPFDSLSLMQNTDDYTIIIVDNYFQNPNIKYVINFREHVPFNEKTVTAALVYMIPNTDLEECMQSLQNQQKEYTFDYPFFFDIVSKVEHRIYDPDMMFNYLLENNIQYILLPQLRMDPTQNTGIYINNTHRFVWVISYKYPDRFGILHVEGKEEPCEIVEFIR